MQSLTRLVIRAIIYCRVSTKKQEKEGDSLDVQEKACTEYCKLNNIQIIGVFKEAYTGKKEARPIFDEAVKNAEANDVNCFIIFDIDRFTREGYGIYTHIKETLKEKGMELKDAKNIIQPSHMVFKDDLVDMSEYEWNIENPSQYAEAILATNAQIEGKKILQRTVPRMIRLEQLGYNTRQPNYGYLNKKIDTPYGRVAIQIPHPVEGECMKEIYEYKERGRLSDKEIVENLNLKGYRKKNGKGLDVKFLQKMICKPIYAGVFSGKWTGNKPIRTPYKGLVDINTWNQANKGKVQIIEIDKNEVKIEYSNGKTIQVNEPIIRKRKNYNPEYPYTCVLLCPHCNGKLSGSASTGRHGGKFAYYHCEGKGGQKHRYYGMKRDDVHHTISTILHDIKINNDTIKLYEFISKQVFEEHTNEFQNNIKTYEEQIKELNKREKEIINNIDKIINFPTILEAKNKEIEDIKIQKEKLEEKKNNKPSNTNLDKFLYYSKNVMEHLDKLALKRENPQLINLFFDVIYNGKIEYEKIKSGTPNIIQLSSLQSQQKNLQNGDLEANHLWFGKSPKLGTPKCNEMKNFVKRMIEIIDRYMSVIERVDFGRL